MPPIYADHMKASPLTLLFVLIVFVALSLQGIAQTGNYTVQLDSMTAQDAAEAKIEELRAQGLNAYLLKSNVPGQGMRYRVRVGRFPSLAAAQAYGRKLKQQGLTEDFFGTVYEGMTPIPKPNAAIKKVEPAPTIPPQTVAPTPQTSAAESVVTPSAQPQPAQRQREVKAVPTNTGTNPVSAPVSTPVSTPAPVKPVSTTPAPTVAPKTVPVPAEIKPQKTTPQLPAPLSDVKPPRDKKASNDAPAINNAPTTSATTTDRVAATQAPNNAVANTNSGAITTATNNAVFTKFEDRSFGYSFEFPNYWNGGNLSPEDLQAQRIDSGAVFRSQEDAAFAHAIWNSLKNANSKAYDNNLIVDLVVKSIGNSSGLQGLTETGRRMVEDKDQIKTFVELRTMFRQPRANAPLEFQGKAVIIRANTGILLVVAFFSKDSAPMMIAAADKIISTARVP